MIERKEYIDNNREHRGPSRTADHERNGNLDDREFLGGALLALGRGVQTKR